MLQIKKLENLKIPLSDIKLATDDFFKAYHMRESEYDIIYTAELEHFDIENHLKEGKNKGELLKRRIAVIIKRFLPVGKCVENWFDKEIQMFATCKHPNIIKLIGFCDEGSEMILVFEHLSNGYLSDYWRNTDMRRSLTWTKRLKICLDVANALNYIHSEMEDQKMIIHRDIKSFCIMLDENWRAKIVQFGQSVFLNQEDDTICDTLIYGTPCYMDPDYAATHKLKKESDVYSFGVVLFEVLCGRLANDPIFAKRSDKYRFELVYMARQFLQRGTLMEIIDPLLKEERGENNFSLNKGPNKDSFEKFVKISHECIAETQQQRPTMKMVVKELKKALSFQESKDEPIISLEIIKLATQNFHDDNRIGRGGFGKVYKVKVPEGDGFNTVVAKRLDTRHGQGELQFRTELQILFEYKHEDIISLVGYCNEKDEKVIVYEYASRGSLDRYLKDAHLTWMKRLNICINVATALAFLHGGAGKQAIVIHRDIKTPNILLNDKWNAKLADFGLSLISPINQETDYAIEHPCGTEGYLDPLYLELGFLTKESDIYSFGVVLFEMMCGKFLKGVIVKEIFEKGKIDDFVLEAIRKQIQPKALIAFKTIAYQCLHDDREKRPTAKEVLKKLKEAREFQISGSKYLVLK
uniref:probable receptor-like protein kinase At2g39360 n=1 Tax=Erigeron canadensis TaxID=72917 RepID=UPI001CB97F0C|nr:probable receptor-like protein kinase At2g39360 [Erigeron canadensis]